MLFSHVEPVYRTLIVILKPLLVLQACAVRSLPIIRYKDQEDPIVEYLPRLNKRQIRMLAQDHKNYLLKLQDTPKIFNSILH